MAILNFVEQLLGQVVYALPVWVLGALFGLLIPREQLKSFVRSFFEWVLAVGKVVLFGTKTHAFQKEENIQAQVIQSEDSEVQIVDDVEDFQWHITREDLKFFFYRSRMEVDPSEELNPWENLMQKEIPGKLRYWAKKRRQNTASKRTEYISATLFNNVSAQEAMDFYLYDTLRPKWDGLIKHVEVLEQGDHSKRCQVVRWLRTFPFAFLNDREYVIARRRFVAKNGDLFGITKTVDHPNAPPRSNTVRMQTFFSMWRTRNVPNPWDPTQVACEVTLLHFEDFGIPEHLARFAVKVGMWGFIKSMAPAMQRFAQERRMRVGPNEEDPTAFGSAIAPGPVIKSRGMLNPSISAGSLASMGSRESTDSKRSSNFKRVASAVLIAGGVAVASNLLQKDSSVSQQGKNASIKKNRSTKR
eukprot:TRINITY_DN2595_c0_g1_i1.p1 TRINITY_DN2595_c0_g1~~TRINITY_DN2595_c0_g1_i1.p1  ORF type:complete len:415 (-),score=40.77 TRINITY_DN2595_c0_g1_i1:920-2164(-)